MQLFLIHPTPKNKPVPISIYFEYFKYANHAFMKYQESIPLIVQLNSKPWLANCHEENAKFYLQKSCQKRG